MYFWKRGCPVLIHMEVCSRDRITFSAYFNDILMTLETRSLILCFLHWDKVYTEGLYRVFYKVTFRDSGSLKKNDQFLLLRDFSTSNKETRTKLNWPDFCITLRIWMWREEKIHERNDSKGSNIFEFMSFSIFFGLRETEKRLSILKSVRLWKN